MFRKEIKPLSESMVDAISKSINRLEYVSEATGNSDRKAPARKGDQSQADSMEKVKEEVELDEISKKTLVNYMDKSKKQSADIQKKFKKGTETKDDEKKFHRRVSGQIKALDKFHGRSKVPAGGVDKAYDAAQKALRKESVELDEAKLPVAKIQKMVDDGKSMDVIVGTFANKRTTNTDEIRKVAKEYMWKKRMKKEEVEGLEEADANSIGQALMKKYGEGSKVVKKSGRYYIKYTKDNSEANIGPFNDLDDVMNDLKEEVDIDESYNEISILKKRIARDTKKMKSLPDFHPQKKKIAILVAKDKKRLDDLFKKQFKNEEFELEEKMDPVGKADADIDNDGDVDSSDKYLHARRKAISKAMKKRKMNEQDTKMGTITVNSDEERKKRAAAYRAKKMKSEEVELDESDKTSLKKHIEKLKKMYKDEEKKNKARNNPYSSPEMSQIAQAIDVYEKRLKEEVELDEAKSATGYTIYHKTFSSAVQHAISQVEKQGYTVDEEEWDRKVAMGPKKPSAGKTNSYTIPLLKNGKPTPRKLQMQVYYDEGRYELNMYIS